MAGVTVTQSEGGTRIVLDMRELEKIIKETPEKAHKIIRKTAFQAERNMKQLAAVDTGAMRNSIHVKLNDFSDATQVDPQADFPPPSDKFTAHVGPAVEYAIYQEFGTHKMAAQPFVVPGLEQTSNEFERNLEELLK